MKLSQRGIVKDVYEALFNIVRYLWNLSPYLFLIICFIVGSAIVTSITETFRAGTTTTSVSSAPHPYILWWFVFLTPVFFLMTLLIFLSFYFKYLRDVTQIHNLGLHLNDNQRRAYDIIEKMAFDEKSDLLWVVGSAIRLFKGDEKRFICPFICVFTTLKIKLLNADLTYVADISYSDVSEIQIRERKRSQFIIKYKREDNCRIEIDGHDEWDFAEVTSIAKICDVPLSTEWR